MTFSSYEEADQEATRLYTEGKYEEVVELLKSVIDQYPDHLYTITWDIAIMYTLMKPQQIEKSLDILEYGYSKGVWYYLDPESKLWESCKNTDRFKELVKNSKERREIAQSKSEPKYEIVLPNEYSDEENYPLHIALHGWGEDISFFKKYWRSNQLSNNHILLFVQSSRVVTPNGFGWVDSDLAKAEIKDSFEYMLNKYEIDENNITIGGFSQGGTTSIDVALNEVIKIKGFITLCPDKPKSFSEETVDSMIRRHLRGVVLTGEKDEAISEQKKMIEVFDQKGFSYRFHINKGLGHWFPDNISQQIDEALDYINR